MDRQLIGEEEHVPMALSGHLKGETESEIIAAQDQALHDKITRQKYYIQKQIGNEDSVRNLASQYTTYWRAQYW
jgi:hypothetical protein